MSDQIRQEHISLFTQYVELYRRRMATFQMVNGIYGTYLTEAQLREITDEVCEGIRRDCHLDVQIHAYLKQALLNQLFGPKKMMWSIKK